MKRMMVSLLLAVGTSLLALSQLGAGHDDMALPSLWSRVQSGGGKAYHVLYQLEMDQSEDLLMLEEWANYDERLFRLDMITASKLRTSFLFDGQSHELFRYKPYTCEHLTPDSKDFAVLSKLFIGYPWSREAEPAADANASETTPFKEPITAFGLGPLWLRANENSKHVRLVPSKQVYESQFKEYEVELEENLIKDQLPYMLQLYFPTGGQHFVDWIDWLIGPNESQKTGPKWKVEARLKVVQLDYEAPDARIFQLPVGYGCRRRSELDHELQIDIGLVLLHEGVPNQIALDVTFSQPVDEFLHLWTSQRYTMRMLRFARARTDSPVKSESVYVTLAQSHSSSGKLVRTKRVWWAPDSSAGLASVYEIDQETGNCRMSHRDVRDQVVLGYLDMGQLGAPGAEAKKLKPMILSVDQISFLFADNNGYHLIESGEPLGANEFRARQYEKRVDNFQLITDGSVTFEGPVSIVKRIGSYARIKKELGDKLASSRKLSLLRDFRTTLTIFFFNKQQDQIEYKIVIELLGNHEVSYAYAHQQMDISACAEGAVSVETGAALPTPSGGKQPITIKYELDDQSMARKLKQRQDTLLSALFVNLFQQPAAFLSPLQLTDARITFDLFTMRLEFTVLDLALTDLFQLELARKLAIVDKSSFDSRNALLETTSSSADLCAQRCEHYNCVRFSYQPSKKACQIELVAGGVKTVDCDECQLYSFFERRSKAVREKQSEAGPARPHLSAAALVEYFEQLVEAAAASDEDQAGATNPLELSITLGGFSSARVLMEPETMRLRPSSLRHELESMNEYERELNEDNARGVNRSQPMMRQLAGRKLKLEFVRLLEDARMLAEHIKDATTYEGCEQACEARDCRSFSYCEYDSSCELSFTHDEKYIKTKAQSVEPRLHCNIYALDYLTKFEAYGRALQPIHARRSVEGTTPRDCANICMETQDLSCQGFFHCRLPAATNKELSSDAHFCYLIDKHVTQFGEAQRERTFGSPPLTLEEAQAFTKSECNFWSRSYLAQFDKYFGKRIQLDAKDLSRKQRDTSLRSIVMTTMDNSDVEYCAQRCTEIGCVGFDLCPTWRGKQACTLVLKGLRSSQLEPAQRCTTFVLSDKSLFNLKKIKLIHDDDARLEPDREAALPNAAAPPPSNDTESVLDEPLERVDESEAEMSLLRRLYEHQSFQLVGRLANSSHWLARLFSFALGLGAGCLLIVAWNEAYSRGWLDRTRQQLSAAYGQRFV